MRRLGSGEERGFPPPVRFSADPSRYFFGKLMFREIAGRKIFLERAVGKCVDLVAPGFEQARAVPDVFDQARGPRVAIGVELQQFVNEPVLGDVGSSRSSC